MNFNSLVWYSSLAIGDEKNSYVADFLNRSCELLNEEINQEIKEKKLPINFKIDFLHIPKGEEGVSLLNNKLKSYTNPVFTNGHSIPKYNPSIVENIKDKSFFYFPQNVTSASYDKFEENVKKRIFKVGRADQPAKLAFIDNEIKKHSSSKVYFFHQELRLSEKMLANHNEDKNFTSFSFKDFDETTADEKIKTILKDLKPEDLLVLDLNLSRFKYIFNYLINSNLQNKVINTFGSVENRFEKISFNLIQLVGNHGIPSVSIEDLMSKIYGENVTPTDKALLLDSTFRLEIPILAFQTLKKCISSGITNIEDQNILETLLSFNNDSDVFVGKRIQYGFNQSNENILKENYAYTFPNSLQNEKFKIPKILHPTQFSTVNGKIQQFNTIYNYIDVLRITNIDIKDKTWTAEFYLDLVSQSEDPLNQVIFNNLSSTNDKFSSKEIWRRKDDDDYNTVRYYIVANFDFLAIADNFPFDWQSVYISMTLKDNSEHILQPIPLELVDDEFDINEWHIENAFSGIKYKKNFLYKDTDLKKTVTVSSENRLGWTLRRKNTATLFKIGIPMFFLTFLVYYSVFLGFDKSGESIGILTTTFLSAIALYFSVEKPEPKKLTIIDIVFIWFYIVNGFTITAFSLSSLITEKIHYYTSGFLKFVIPLSLISIAVYLNKRVQNNRKDIILDRDL
ncbi:hypothetical protein [Candidatus Pelagibacter communis]|uniref:hypothetical protein n=1 Tax=Pelagibacter ubique TaxID=198252 RepID=UPI00094C267F|nr:hypothetical protein [Candidatus Pelagibacter ubique]